MTETTAPIPQSDIVEAEAARTSTEPPLVTFALFAYNQERYIREAVEGAFAQTYQPLEIILSDDCSTDRTFEIMQEMADAYQGPHELRLNRNAENIGTLGHVLRVGKQAAGALVVMAAGDDISLPHRTTALAGAWLKSGALAICSSFHVISDAGETISSNQSPRQRSNGLEDYVVRSDGHPVYSIHGASSSYDRRLLSTLPYPETQVIFEDMVFSFMLNRMGRHLEYIDAPLLLYRRHSRAIVNRLKTPSRVDTVDFEQLAQRRAKQHYETLHCIRKLNDNIEATGLASSHTKLDVGSLSREMQFAFDRKEWGDFSLRARLSSIMSLAAVPAPTQMETAPLVWEAPQLSTTA